MKNVFVVSHPREGVVGVFETEALARRFLDQPEYKGNLSYSLLSGPFYYSRTLYRWETNK